MDSARWRAHARPSSVVKPAAPSAYPSPVMRPHTIFKWHRRSRRTFWARLIALCSSWSICAGVANWVDAGLIRTHAVAVSAVTVNPSARIL